MHTYEAGAVSTIASALRQTKKTKSKRIVCGDNIFLFKKNTSQDRETGMEEREGGGGRGREYRAYLPKDEEVERTKEER